MPYICINNKPIEGNYNDWLEFLKEGESYEGYIVDNGVGQDGKIFPCLVIPKITDDHGFDIKRFVESSDLDETTLVNEEWEKKVCEPVNVKV